MITTGELYFRELEIDTLARTMWGEARGEGSIGMQTVACVVMNRLAISQQKGKFWWGHSVIDICQKPYQFSCWNRDDPNYRKVLHVDRRDRFFACALALARQGIAGRLADPTGGATHYHAAGAFPYWSRAQEPTAVIGKHIFYRILT
ncbi:MAG: cell wall hydrolase [Micavibrio aeruginosavorus]|uniref:Cell wall hydrolase n=1 Tax=Micavibrio aeruginosavorus TaxID=349221 RepID=A0A7T5R231_9BACT|nr:MAG: cell wall hydrolase [Micavibrio aeruginosavorus]